jgi:CRP-like cAMP-binding protein
MSRHTASRGRAPSHGHEIGLPCFKRRRRAAFDNSQGERLLPSIHQVFARNRLLDALPDGQLRRMRAGCEVVELSVDEVLFTPGQYLRHVYFPTRSYVSLVLPVDASDSLEVGLVGDEGMIGVPLALGVDVSPLKAVVQGAGSALRMEAEYFSGELEHSQALLGGVNRYVFVWLHQLARRAACTRFHVVESRLARWLLMTQDRAHAASFDVTHETLSFMLGVRRVGITNAASSLQRRRLIRYRRGRVTVLDRRGLRAASCTCYRADRQSYDRIIG